MTIEGIRLKENSFRENFPSIQVGYQFGLGLYRFGSRSFEALKAYTLLATLE